MKKSGATSNKNIQGSLRVAVKQGQTIDILRREFAPDHDAPLETISEKIARILRGAERLQAAFQHQLDRLTFGAFSRFGGMVLAKVFILLIIMFFGWREIVGSTEDASTFASTNITVEKTHTDKRLRKNNTAPASIGNGMSFDLAPAAPEELHAQTVKSYIAHFSQMAVNEMDKTGIPASITMAQAIIESRSGTSVLSVRNNNHFGIKCFSRNCPTGHCTNYTDDNHKDFFRKYPNPTASFQEHSAFLLKHRYHELLKYGKNYKVWAKGLREFGYATDQSYDKKLIAIIERYELNKLDDL